MVGNYTDNGVHEQGTDEARTAYQADTPGQTVHSFIKEREKSFHEQKKKVRKHFSQVFQNPLKGFPYNEDIKVKPLREGTWAYANTVDKMKALNKMLKTSLIIKTKADLKKAEASFGRIIGDDLVYDAWGASVDDRLKVDARKAVVKHLEDWGFTVKNFQITHYPENLIKETIQEAYAAALVKKAIKLANSPKSKKDFMGILSDIEKLKKGLTKDPKVHKVLRGVPQKGKLPGPMMKMYGPFAKEEVEEGKYLKYSDLLLKKSRELSQIDKQTKKNPNYSLNALKSINKEIEKEMKKLGIQEKGNLKPPKGKQKLLRLGDDLEETDVDEGVFSRIAQDIEDGVNANKIAKKYGVDLKTIKGWIGDFKKDLMRKSPRYTKEDLQRVTAEYIYGLTEGEIGDVEKLMKKGMNAKQIGKKKGYSPRRIKALTSMMQLMKQLQQNETHADNRKDDEDMKKKKNAFVQAEGQDPIENWLKDWGYGMKEKKGVDGRTKAFKEKLINLGYSKADIEATMKESVVYDKPSFEEFQERMDGSMLTGQEISSYFRKNPVRDKLVRKAATIALDHSGAMTYAVKKIEKLKRGLSNHKDVKKALQFANEEVTFEEVIEGFSEPQIKKLKSAYAGLKGVDPTSPTGKKLLMMMKGRGEDELIALYKADINFISLLAASNLIARFKYDSQKIIQLRKEDQEYLASNPSLFERILAERQGDLHLMDIDPKVFQSLAKALKKAQNKLGRGARVMQDTSSITISNIHPVWGASEVERVLSKLKISRNDVDIRMENYIGEAPVLPSTQAGEPTFDYSVEDGVKAYEDVINKQLNAGRFAKLHKERKTEMKARKASKYYRVEEWEMGRAGSIHAFIDISNGDIFKPAGWKAPAKGARGNVRDKAYINYVSKYPDAYYGGHLYK